mmetsp:Transcript_14307/g.28940  ORF Transcript_14307/g.28940 Transcript_14307/m.28940 type:complete len:267 (-) Transcript_14307:393-1193(-)
MLAPEHPEHASSLVSTHDDGAEVRDHEGGGRGTALGVVRICNREQQHDEDTKCKVATRSVDDRENGKVFWPPEHVATDLLPATLVAAAVHALELLGVGGGVPGEVALQGLHEDDRNDRAQEKAEHEGIDDREPMDFVLEELWVKIPHCTVLEGLVGCVPYSGVAEVQRGPLIHWPGIRRLHVHLDDLVPVPEEREMAVREDARERLALEVFGHRGCALCIVRGVARPHQLRKAADIQAKLGVLPNEGPNGKVVDVELIPVVVVDHC